jgi:hypothetical protein
MPNSEDQSQESCESLVPVRSYASIQTVVHIRDFGHEDFEPVRRHSSDEIAYTTIVQEGLFVRCVKDSLLALRDIMSFSTILVPYRSEQFRVQ